MVQAITNFERIVRVRGVEVSVFAELSIGRHLWEHAADISVDGFRVTDLDGNELRDPALRREAGNALADEIEDARESILERCL